MIENTVLKAIDIVYPKIDYWFVRTDGGLHFDEYLKDEFIAIGWNEISKADLNLSESEIRKKIAFVNKLDKKIPTEQGKITETFNKIKRFATLRKGDIIVMPSERSEKLAFGYISDEEIYEEKSNKEGCPHLKRRKVEWVTKSGVYFDSLDDVFYKIRKSRHAISSINEYADHIDSEMYSVYHKDKTSHFVLNVKFQGKVNWLQLASFLKDMHTMMEVVNEEFKLNEDVLGSSIQISLQSPGILNLAQRGVSIVLLATLLGASSCSDVKGSLNPNDQKKLDLIEANNSDTLHVIKNTLKDMSVIL